MKDMTDTTLRDFEEIKNNLEAKGFKVKVDPKGRYVGAYVSGLKAEYNVGSSPLAVKLVARAKNDEEHTMEQLNDFVIDNYGEDSIVEKRKKAGSKVINFLKDISPDKFIEVVEDLAENEFDLEFPYGDGTKAEVLVGPTFANTVFENIKERGATMSGMFGSMVCEAADMSLKNTLAEYYTNAGEIDGVELDENENVISIYECQSGIHKGSYLDETHLNKSLGKYLYDSKVIGTVRKVVILAGGYYADHLNLIRERASELANRKTPIEIVLLKTTKSDGRIKIERVNF